MPADDDDEKPWRVSRKRAIDRFFLSRLRFSEPPVELDVCLWGLSFARSAGVRVELYCRSLGEERNGGRERQEKRAGRDGNLSVTTCSSMLSDPERQPFALFLPLARPHPSFSVSLFLRSDPPHVIPPPHEMTKTPDSTSASTATSRNRSGLLRGLSMSRPPSSQRQLSTWSSPGSTRSPT